MWLLKNKSLADKMGRLGSNWIKKNRTYKILAKNLEQNYLNISGH